MGAAVRVPVQFPVRLRVLEMNVRVLVCGELRRCVLAVRVIVRVRSARVRIYLVRGARQHASSQDRVPSSQLPQPIPATKRVLTESRTPTGGRLRPSARVLQPSEAPGAPGHPRRSVA